MIKDVWQWFLKAVLMVGVGSLLIELVYNGWHAHFQGVEGLDYYLLVGVSAFLFFAILHFLPSFRLGFIGTLLGKIWDIFQFFSRCSLILVICIYRQFHPLGAAWMGYIECSFRFNRWQRGLLLDGNHMRLSMKRSLPSAICIGPSGMGKSTLLIIPGIFSMARDGRSLVMTDTSGEIYNKTSGYLKSCGYKIRVLDLINPAKSDPYNPMSALTDFNSISNAITTIVNASPGAGNDKSDPIWSQESSKILKILSSALLRYSEQHGREYLNLPALKMLVNSFDSKTNSGGAFDRWVTEFTLDDPLVYGDYLGLLTAPPNTFGGILSTANAVLAALSDPLLASITGTESAFKFSELKREKVAYYILVEQQDISFYSLILGVFFTQLFSALIHDLDPKHRKVVLFLDEWGMCWKTQKSFISFACTARKYGCFFLATAQSKAQLAEEYGKNGCTTLFQSVGTEIGLAGLDITSAREFSARLGREKKPFYYDWATRKSSSYREQDLITPEAMIHLKNNQFVMLHSNLKGLKVTATPYYKHSKFSQYAQLPPYQRDSGHLPKLEAIKFVELADDLPPPELDSSELDTLFPAVADPTTPEC